MYPFEKEPSTGQVAVPQNADHSDRPYQVTALGFLTNTGKLGDRYKMNLPGASVTDGAWPDGGCCGSEVGEPKEADRLGGSA